jgi:iron(II)-dependent oxidoreductase
MEAYLARVRAATLTFLEEVESGRSSAPPAHQHLLRDNYVFHLVLEHERQHQETLAYLLQMLDPAKKRRAIPAIAHGEMLATQVGAPVVRDMVTIPAGEFQMGAPWNSFAYDNELPAHTVALHAFRIDRLLTTNEEYAGFIAEGGYERREWWSEEGWAWREREQWTHPLYWSRESLVEGGGARWNVRTMFGEGSLPADHPVAGVSWYEAEAYARFMGKRLPTEAEWEKAASWDASNIHDVGSKRLFAWGDAEPSGVHGNFDLRFWNTTPVGAFPTGASSYGCFDMTGNVWEWTSDLFAGYTGFKAYPYPEYSEAWFDNDHRVLKGGSWATHPSILRTSFRNFFRRHFRIAFAGIRCAADA